MKKNRKNSSIMAIALSLILCLVFSACDQANSAPTSSAEPTPEPTPAFTPAPASTPTPTPKVVDYEALATRLNNDVEPPHDDAEASAEAESVGSTTSGGIFEAGEKCVIYRFWSAGIGRELIDLLGNDGTEQGAAVYSELLKSFVSSYDALQKAVTLYEPDAKLVLHVVESSEASTPIIVVENGEVTYDYATEQGYFVDAEGAGVVEAAPAEEAAG